MAVKPIPDGYHSVTPFLIVPEVAKLLDFLKQAFEAQELHRMPRPDGTIMHAEVRIGDSLVMMGEPMGNCQPMFGSLYLYVRDVDAVYKRALPRRVSQRTSSMGTAVPASRTRLATSGGSPPTRKTCHPRRSPSGPRLSCSSTEAAAASPIGASDRWGYHTAGRCSLLALSYIT